MCAIRSAYSSSFLTVSHGAGRGEFLRAGSAPGLTRQPWLCALAEWAVRELLAVTYVTGAVALALALWTRWSDPGFLPQGLAAERLASQDAPGRHTVTPEVALYWKHRRAYGLTPVAAAPSKEPAEAAGWCGASGAGPQSEAVCPTCRLHKPLRASHCAASGRCVARLDHHCAWLGCAVGASNHARFVAFLWVAAAHFAVSCATCSVTVLGPLSGGTGGAGALSSVVLTGLCAVSAVFTAFAGALVADQALNIATDTTVRERKRGLAGGGPGAAPASAWAGRWRRSTWHAADNTIRFWAEGL